MPTLLVPTLAVVALLPLTTSRPSLDHVTATSLFRSDGANTMDDNLLSCIEDDTTLVDKLNTCIRHDAHLEENITDGISFGLLDEDWHRLQLLRSQLPKDVLLKGELVRVFRALLASFYRAYFARLAAEMESRDKVSPYNANKNDNISVIKGETKIVDDRTDTKESLGVRPLYPTSTDQPASEDHISNEIIYEESGSNREYSVVDPPVEGVSNSITLDTDRPYGVSDATSGKSSHEGENNDIYDITTELDNQTKKLRDGIDLLDSDSYYSKTFGTTAVPSLEQTESAGTKHESNPNNNNIIVKGENDVDITILPTTYSIDRNMGTDIDENELFPPMKITTSTEATEENNGYTKERPDFSGDVKINIDNNNISPEEYDAEGTNPTEHSYHSSQYVKTIPNDAAVTQNHDQQTGQPTDQSLNENELNRQQTVSKATTNLDFSYVTSTPDFNKEGKENEADTDESSGPVSNSVADIVPTDPTILPYDPNLLPNYNTLSDVVSDKTNIEPLSITSYIDSTSEKQISDNVSSGILYDYEKFPDSQPSTNLPERQNTNKIADITESYKNINYASTTEIEDSKNLYGTEKSDDYSHISSISPLSSSAQVPSYIKTGKDENKDFQTETSNIDNTNNFTPEETKSPRDSITNPFEKTQFPIDVASTQGADSNIYYEGRTSDDTKGPLDTSQEPDFKDNHEQEPTIVYVSTIEDTTTAVLTASEKENDRNSNLPDDTVHKATSTEPFIVVSPSPQSKSQDDFYIDSDNKYDETPTSTIVHLFDDNRSNTKSTHDIEVATEENILPNINNTTTDLEGANRTESLNKFHIFSIPLPEVQNAKHANVIVNTLRIFPVNNEHMTIFQPSYKRGCLSNNDCVQVGSAVNRDSKQRRASSDVEGGHGGEDHLSAGNLDSVLWWHKMRALKKKFR